MRIERKRGLGEQKMESMDLILKKRNKDIKRGKNKDRELRELNIHKYTDKKLCIHLSDYAVLLLL